VCPPAPSLFPLRGCAQVSTSRYWFNYRHTTNALTIYHRLRRAGVSDDNIVLMLADDFACDPRNPERGRLYSDLQHSDDINRDVVVDYRGNDVSARNFLNVLSGRHAPGTAATQRLQSDAGSDVLLYMTGHGGDEFLKFRDFEEMTAVDLGVAISEAHIGQRYSACRALAAALSPALPPLPG
jgi:phosphatidylinositol glycan class K